MKNVINSNYENLDLRDCDFQFLKCTILNKSLVSKYVSLNVILYVYIFHILIFNITLYLILVLVELSKIIILCIFYNTIIQYILIY